jgi:zinc protease
LGVFKTLAAVLGLGLLLCGIARAEGAPAKDGDSELVQPNPRAEIGRLPNGLRYAVMQHPSHGRAAMILYIDVGSFEETDTERGLAHFLEHMAFSGSRSFPSGELIKRFEAAGIAVGQDQNASTGVFGTTYSLDIPEVDEAKLNLGLTWLRDIADGLLIPQADVDRERGVVLAELIQRDSVGESADEASAAFFTPHLRAIDRAPGGKAAIVKAADAAAIRAFYERWYRPENATVIIVGSESKAVMKARIEKAFGSWRAVRPASPRPEGGDIDPARALAAASFTAPNLISTVQVCKFQASPPHQPESVPVWRQRLADEAWTYALEERLNRLARTSPPPLLRPSANVQTELYFKLDSACLRAASVGEDWKSALATLETEARRFARYGITHGELDRFQTDQRNFLASGVAGQSADSAASMANVILANLVSGDTFSTAEEDQRVHTRALGLIDKATVDQAFRQRWPDTVRPLIFVTAAAKPSEADITAAWTRAAATEPAPPTADTPALAWPYRDFGPPGRVVKREVMHDPDFVRLTFANGVVVNFKQTDFAKGQVGVDIRFGAGLSELPASAAPVAVMASSRLLSGGLGKLGYEDLIKICRGHVCGVQFAATQNAFVLSGVTRSPDLVLELQLLTALLSDPGFRPDEDGAMSASVDAFYRGMTANPHTAASVARMEALEPTAKMPPEAMLAALKSTDFAALLRRPLTTDALEVTLVGDVDEATARIVLGATLGALPPRDPTDKTRADTPHLRFPASGPHMRISTTHQGPKDQAAILMDWPLFVRSPAHQHDIETLTVLAAILQNLAFDDLREQLGKTYSPTVSTSFPLNQDQGAMTLSIETTPAAVPQMIAAARALAQRLQGGQITADDLDRARKPLLANAARQESQNGWWLGALDGSARRPAQLAEAQTELRDLAAVTLDEVKAAARTWLAQTPVVTTALPAAEAPSEAIVMDKPK